MKADCQAPANPCACSETDQRNIVRERLPRDLKGAHVSTFHSFALRVISAARVAPCLVAKNRASGAGNENGRPVVRATDAAVSQRPVHYANGCISAPLPYVIGLSRPRRSWRCGRITDPCSPGQQHGALEHPDTLLFPLCHGCSPRPVVEPGDFPFREGAGVECEGGLPALAVGLRV